MRYIYTLLTILFLLPFSGNSQIIRLKEGSALYDKYRYIDAQEVYKKVVEKGHKSADIYGDLADSYYYQSNYKEALVWYELLLNEFPDEITEKQYLRTVQSLKSNRKNEQAQELLDAFQTKFGKETVAQQYANNPNYLKSIDIFGSGYATEKLGINMAGSGHSPMFLGDTKVIFASSDSKQKTNIHSWDGGTFLDLFVADIDTLNGRLRNKRPIQGDINTELHESAAVFTQDGNTMYFTRNNIVDGKKIKDAQNVIRVKIFKAELQGDDSWKVVEDLSINGDDFSTAYPALNRAENKLYFSSDREGSLGMSDIWFIDLYEDDTYGYPVHLGEFVNTEGREAFLFIDKEDVLYFSSDGHQGHGGLDVFKTKLNSRGMPTQIHNLGEPFNSPQDDFGLIIDLTKESGYFTSNRSKGGSINDELFYFYQECIMEIHGVLRDSSTKEAIAGGRVKVLNEFNETIFEVLSGDDGSFVFEVDCADAFFLEGQMAEYIPNEIDLAPSKVSVVVNQDIELDPMKELIPDDLGSLLSLNPIYFGFDDYLISSQAEVELAKIVEAMNLYKDMVIHIESHTDSRGNEVYNQGLSNRRAASTMQWLISQGIDKARLSAKGYGETQLINGCFKGSQCSEQQHLLNRRSVFKIQD